MCANMKAKENKGKPLTQLQKDFLQLFPKKSWVVSKTCNACNINRRTYYNWLKNPTFADAVEDCIEDDKDWVEDLMRLRMRGLPILDDKNIIVGWKVPPSDTMLIWWSKCKMPERGFAEKNANTNDTSIKIEHTFVDGKAEDKADFRI